MSEIKETKPWGYKNKQGRLFRYTPTLEKQRSKMNLSEVPNKPKSILDAEKLQKEEATILQENEEMKARIAELEGSDASKENADLKEKLAAMEAENETLKKNQK